MSRTIELLHGDARLDAHVSARIHELGAHASAVLDAQLPLHRCDDVMSAKQFLSWVWETTITTLSTPTSLATPATIGHLTDILTQVRLLEADVDDARVAASVELMRRIRRALSHLDNASTPDQLLALAAEEACTLGFDRVGASTVDDEHWRLTSMVIDRDPRLAEDMLAASRDEPPILRRSVEEDVVTTRRPLLVHGVQESPRVARQLVALSGCTSYGVAPLTSRGAVVGLLHADSFYPRRDVDGSDLAVLSLFARGVSQALERVTSTAAAASGHGSPQASSSESPSQGPVSATLSARELDVIEQMAAGRGNLAIARELCISEGTVKTHITHILRKLDAANRAEAVAYWLRR